MLHPTSKQPRLRADGAVDVKGLQPISVERALWRIVASALCKRASTREWARAWAPPESYCALQGQDCFGGLLCGDQAVHVEGCALAAFDLTKALIISPPAPQLPCCATLVFGSDGPCAGCSLVFAGQAVRWDSWVGSSIPQSELSPFGDACVLDPVLRVTSLTFVRC